MENGTITHYSDIATTTSVEVIGNNPVVNLFAPLFSSFGDQSWFSLDGILNTLNTLWLVYAVLAYIFSILLLALYVYGSISLKKLLEADAEAREQIESLYEEKYKGSAKNSRLEDMLTHIDSDSPNDWKLAIIEADIILDDLLKSSGYAGSSPGERLRSISVNQLQSLDDAWQAHKVRNQIAHSGSDFILTQKIAQDTIKQYRRVFNELGIK